MDPVTDAGRNPTMLDVAREAGVSRALVSIIMRGAPGASERTRAHVKQVAARLGYVPDARAQALRRQGNAAIGVAFQPDQPFQAALIDAIYESARRADHPVILSAVTPGHDEERAVASLVGQRCGAVITLGSRLDRAVLEATARRIPVVVVARTVEAVGVDTVVSDDASGLGAAVAHLASLGHTRIAFAQSAESGGNPERLAGYLGAMDDLGLAPDVVAGGSRIEGGAEAARTLLAREGLPTAVVCFNDAAAAGMQDVLTRAGVRVPVDVSIVGIDDSETASLSYRQLTSIRQDPVALARAATARAAQRIASPGLDRFTAVIPTSLVVRTSTGPRVPDAPEAPQP